MEGADEPVKQRKPEEMLQYMMEKVGFTEVPAEFILPPHIRPAQQQRSQVEGKDSVPVIDMALLKDEQGKKQVQSEITRACEEWGFFQIINHSVPATLMDAMMDMSRRFFALPAEQKEVFKQGNATSFQGYGRIFSRKSGDTREWNDRLILDSAKNVNDPVAFDLVIDKPPGFQDVYNEYGKALYQVAKELMALISEELGQRSDFLFNKIGKESTSMRTAINYYPACPQPELVLGVQPHGDGSALTILQQDEIPRLEILKGGSRISIPPSTDHALVVNMGDVLQITSNERFKSSLHRVVAPRTSRISIACFTVPHGETLLQPAAELCNELNPPVYRDVTYHDYVLEYVKRGLDMSSRAVEHFRMVPATTAM